MCSLDSVTVHALPQNKSWTQAINPMDQQYATRYGMFLLSQNSLSNFSTSRKSMFSDKRG